MEVLNDKIINQGMSIVEFEEEKRLKLDLNEILVREECFWRQKSKDVWLNEGDKNNKIFHKLATVNRC